ncbi:sacsin N-terminal ATP-binding-like domain-containing protein [Promicromonospora vindobonensis]|uniref:Sacsin N-terminal ATP-binding-like domain-containing protein n=1 Tax=Promicromonospora vindobonensis TaxID=195748 RepID=A0ABW5VPK6_9MICO
MTSDPFGTGALRRAVTEAWRASPTRFREDANSEEDHARGYYRDRVVVELAQNAADAAARAGVPGRLVLRLEPAGPADGGPARGAAGDGGLSGAGAGWRLVAANTGAPLDADGVASLASLRASAKTGRLDGAAPVTADVVGRFGVGFAAVRSVSDDVLVRSRDGGVRFSLAATRAELGLGPADAEFGPLAQAGAEVGPLHRDRSIDGPISMQGTDLDADAQQPTDLGREATARGGRAARAAAPVPRARYRAGRAGHRGRAPAPRRRRRGRRQCPARRARRRAPPCPPRPRRGVDRGRLRRSAGF